MKTVKRAAVTDLHDRRSRRVTRARAARRTLERAQGERRDERAGGRVWVNGAELGGTDPRHHPLALSYD